MGSAVNELDTQPGYIKIYELPILAIVAASEIRAYNWTLNTLIISEMVVSWGAGYTKKKCLAEGVGTRLLHI